MKRIKQFFQAVSLKQLLGVVLAGFLVLASTACGQPRVQAPTSNNQYNPNTPGQAMYPHKDTERDTSAADAQTERMVKRAQRNLQKTKGPGDVLENVTPDKSPAEQAKDLGQSAQRAAENVGKSTQRAAKNAAENTQEGLRNLGENTQDAVDRAAKAVDRATNPG
jgi:hypothetical protein